MSKLINAESERNRKYRENQARKSDKENYMSKLIQKYGRKIESEDK